MMNTHQKTPHPQWIIVGVAFCYNQLSVKYATDGRCQSLLIILGNITCGRTSSVVSNVIASIS